MKQTPFHDFSGQWTGQSKILVLKDNPMLMSTTTPSKVGTVSEREIYLRLKLNCDKTSYEGSIYGAGSTDIQLNLPKIDLDTEVTDLAFTGKNEIVEFFPQHNKIDSIIKGRLHSNHSMHLEWNTAYAKHEATLLASHTVISPIAPSQEVTWDEFKRIISLMKPSDFIFRGQKHCNWRLRTSFFRSGGNDLKNYFEKIMPDLQRSINSISNYTFSETETSAILNLAQHHGFPTPLIDWTESPYVAAYFAFRGIEGESQNGKSKIYVLNRAKWNVKKPQKHFDRQTRESFRYLQQELYIDFVDLPILNNSRAMPQQALVGVTNIDDIEAYFARNYTSDEILQSFVIPHTEKDYVLRDLNYMGINAATLFPGLDGLCEKFKNKYF